MILVIGGGFLGGSIYRRLKSNGHTVKVFSRSSVQVPAADLIQGEIENLDKHPTLLNGVNMIIHALHTTVPADSMGREIDDVTTNIIPLLKLLDKCKTAEVKKFVFISTGGAIYGQNDKAIACSENHVTNPISSYGITKLAMEKYVQYYQEYFANGIVILRPSNIYGVGQTLKKPQGVVAHLLNALLNDKEFTVWGDGLQRKDYLYIDDFLNLIEKVLFLNTNLIEQIYNISSGEQFSVYEMIALAEKQFGKTLSHINNPLIGGKFDVRVMNLDHALATRTFNWEPTVTLNQGMEQIIKQLR